MKLFCIFVFLFALSGCSDKQYIWYQKLTATVETPDGVVTGSAITKILWEDVTARGRFPNNYWGEATVVDLGDDRYLFVLLDEGTRYLGLRTFLGDAGLSAERFQKMTALRGEKEVSVEYYPLLVTFDDISDPASVREVDPNDLDAAFGLCADGSGLKDADAPWRGEGLSWAKWLLKTRIRENAVQTSREAGFEGELAAALEEHHLLRRNKNRNEAERARYKALDTRFGPDGEDYAAWRRWWTIYSGRKFLQLPTKRDTSADCHRLKQITLEITDEPVTTGEVEKVLGWLGEYPEPSLCEPTGRSSNIPFCWRVKHGRFIRR